jgi:MFS family permease
MSESINPGFRWLVFVTMFIVTATASIFLIAPAPFIGEMLRTTPGLSAGQVVLMTMTSFNIFVAVSAILCGILIDKFGIMKFYIGGLLLIGIGALLTPFIGSSSLGIIFIRSLQGIGAGPIMVSVLPIAARYFPPKLRSLIIVLQGLAVSFGVQIGLILVPKIIQTTQSWQTVMAWLAPICIFGLIFSFFVLLSSKQQEDENSKVSFKEDIMTALSNPVTWVVIVCLALQAWFYQAFSDLIPTYLNTPSPAGLGYDQRIAGTLMSSASWIFICGGFIGVLITERFLRGNARPVVLSAFVLQAIFICLIIVPAMASNHMILGISVYTISFFSAFIQPQALGHIAKYYPKHITGTLGGLIGISVFTGIAGPMVSATAMLMSGGFQLPFSIMVGIAVIGAIVAIFLKPVKED